MFRKTVRSLQNYFPSLGEAKNEAYHFARTRLGSTHDASYAAIRSLPRRRPELFVDVGGNRGQSIIAFRRFRPEAAVVSFEPSPFMFRWLADHFGAWRDVRLEPYGLGASTDTLPLFVPSYRGFTYDGLATMRPEHARSFFSSRTLFGYDPAKVTVAEVTCQVRTLDSFALAPTFIKVDVEGGEHQVLLGARRTLEAHRPALMLERFYEKWEVSELLAELDYRQATPRGGRFEPGVSTGLNMFWLPAEQLGS